MPLKPGDENMLKWTGSSIVQAMAWRRRNLVEYLNSHQHSFISSHRMNVKRPALPMPYK